MAGQTGRELEGCAPATSGGRVLRNYNLGMIMAGQIGACNEAAKLVIDGHST